MECTFPTDLMKRLTLPDGKLRMVLDTDTYNEVDDQFALSFALLSPKRLDVEAVYAAPFFNDRSSGPADGMERSYQEILRLLEKLHVSPDGFAFRGSAGFMKDRSTPIDSPAVRDLIARARAVPQGENLYVAAIGAITNIASALLLAPDIRDKVVLLWLGGQPHTQFSAREFNLSGDIPAAQVIFDSGVPLIQVPCQGVSSHLLASVPELEAWLKGANPLCDMLIDIFSSYRKDHFAWAKEIWDVAVIGYMLNPSWTRSVIVPTPRLSAEGYYAIDPSRPPMREVTYLNRNAIFYDLFQKLRAAKP